MRQKREALSYQLLIILQSGVRTRWRGHTFHWVDCRFEMKRVGRYHLPQDCKLQGSLVRQRSWAFVYPFHTCSPLNAERTIEFDLRCSRGDDGRWQQWESTSRALFLPKQSPLHEHNPITMYPFHLEMKYGEFWSLKTIYKLDVISHERWRSCDRNANESI